MSKNISIARNLAMYLHAGQTRKGSDVAYFMHCEDVANIMAAYDHDYYEMRIMVGYLHDTIEDCGITSDELLNALTGRQMDILTALEVCQGVVTLTHKKHDDLTRAENFAVYTEKLRKARIEWIEVKLADIISNCSDISTLDAKFARTYLKEKYYQVQQLYNDNLNKYLYNLAIQTIKKSANLVGILL